MPAAMKQDEQIHQIASWNPNNFTYVRDKNMCDMSLEKELQNLQEYFAFDKNTFF
jgi:cell fate regulator YaaT (PSP1 superfamily)